MWFCIKIILCYEKYGVGCWVGPVTLAMHVDKINPFTIVKVWQKNGLRKWANIHMFQSILWISIFILFLYFELRAYINILKRFMSSFGISNTNLHFWENTKNNSCKNVSQFTNQLHGTLRYIWPTARFKYRVVSYTVSIWKSMNNWLINLTYNSVVHSNESACIKMYILS